MVIVLKLSALCFVLFMFVFCAWAVRRTLKERLIMQGMQNAMPINAEIIQRRPSFGRSNAYYVTYRYRIGQGDSYTREQAVSEKYYQGLKSNVSIRYLPENPQISRIVDDPDRDPIKATTFVAFFSATLLLCSLFLSGIILWGIA
jgi:hypothetical protein